MIKFPLGFGRYLFFHREIQWDLRPHEKPIICINWQGYNKNHEWYLKRIFILFAR